MVLKYAKIIDNTTGLCEVGVGTNSQFYESIGMSGLDVQQSDIDGAWYLKDRCPMKSEEEKEREERERLSLLSMTKREMFLGLYNAKGITPDMLKAKITDPAALIEFEYANDYYRGNPLIDIMGTQLGFTTEQLDRFFETKDYKYLTTCTLTVNVVPEEATVIINDVEQKQIIVPYGASVDVNVECEGYIGTTYMAFLTEDKVLDVELEKEVIDEDTTDDNESDVPNELDTTTSGTDETDTYNVE